jgi:hypothetical protein
VPTRGALRDRHGCRARDAVDVIASSDVRWGHGRPSRVVPIPRRWGQALARISRGRWRLTSPVRQGEHEAAVKTIAQGRPVVLAALSLLACAKCTFFARKARGCGQHPAFPAPSPVRGRDACKTRTLSRRGNVETWFCGCLTDEFEVASTSALVIARSEATKQSIAQLAGAWIASLRSQ